MVYKYIFCQNTQHWSQKYSVVVCVSIGTLNYLKLLLTKIRKHQKTEEYQGLEDRGELDLNSDVNLPASEKLRQ